MHSLCVHVRHTLVKFGSWSEWIQLSREICHQNPAKFILWIIITNYKKFTNGQILFEAHFWPEWQCRWLIYIINPSPIIKFNIQCLSFWFSCLNFWLYVVFTIFEKEQCHKPLTIYKHDKITGIFKFFIVTLFFGLFMKIQTTVQIKQINLPNIICRNSRVHFVYWP